ncbi:MAG: hypothetical protein ACE5PO_05255 [Candidatus Bathyarchaeia archaeon]
MNPRRFILEKMLRHEWIGGRHTSADNIPRGRPSHEHKAIKKELKNLIRDGWVTAKPTSYGLQVSLNPRCLKLIHEYIQQENQA